MHEIPMPGCRPDPLAHYMKGLAVIRLVAEQADPLCRGWWENDVFRLRSSLDPGGLVRFFLHEYRPTPVVAPWNRGSGFFPDDNQDAIRLLESSVASRFQDYREAIENARWLLKKLDIHKKPNEEEKESLLVSARGMFSDTVIAWMDAAVTLTAEGVHYPPLLGTGGNDGRLDFTNNFMQRLMDLFDPSTGAPMGPAGALLKGSLFGEPVAGLQREKAIGQFFPGAAGGANGTVGFSAASLINPWDFVLTIEGALAFASAATRRLGSGQPGVASYPFAVRAAGVGYGSADGSDENPRGEIWLPLWSRPASYAEISSTFSEGRAQVGRRAAIGGVDFARAVAGLGVDRGIESFERYGFHVRNGLAYFASPLGRWPVVPRTNVDLLSEIDSWLGKFRAKATSKQGPARIGAMLRAIERTIMDFCREGGPRRLSEVLMALGEAEMAVARSPRFRADADLSPIPPLSASWVQACDDGSVEFRVAAAVASVGVRENLEPVRSGPRVRWLETDSHPAVVWSSGDLVGSMAAVVKRRCVDARREGRTNLPLGGRCPASLGDVARFLRREVDDARIEALVKGLALVNWSDRSVRPLGGPAEPLPPTFFALIRLVHLGHALDTVEIPWDASILVRAMAGDGVQASRLAVRRLKGSGLMPLVEVVNEPADVVRRAAAALLIPVSERDASRLADLVLRREVKNQEPM